jgi:hypothetical protein
VPHPAYNPHPAPIDFLLFATVKTELQGYEIHGRKDLILAKRTIFHEIPKETLNSVYISWITKLKWLFGMRGVPT